MSAPDPSRTLLWLGAIAFERGSQVNRSFLSARPRIRVYAHQLFTKPFKQNLLVSDYPTANALTRVLVNFEVFQQCVASHARAIWGQSLVCEHQHRTIEQPAVG